MLAHVCCRSGCHVATFMKCADVGILALTFIGGFCDPGWKNDIGFFLSTNMSASGAIRVSRFEMNTSILLPSNAGLQRVLSDPKERCP